jgi:hypothetical protein
MLKLSCVSLQEEEGVGADAGDGCGAEDGADVGDGCGAGDGAYDMTKQIHYGHCEYKCKMTKTKLGVIVYIPKLTQLDPAADTEHPI